MKSFDVLFGMNIADVSVCTQVFVIVSEVKQTQTLRWFPGTERLSLPTTTDANGYSPKNWSVSTIKLYIKYTSLSSLTRSYECRLIFTTPLTRHDTWEIERDAIVEKALNKIGGPRFS